MQPELPGLAHLVGGLPRTGQLLPIAAAAGLALLSSLLLAWAYRHAEAQQVTFSEYTAFLWSTLLGAAVFGERVLPPLRGGPGPQTEAAA